MDGESGESHVDVVVEKVVFSYFCAKFLRVLHIKFGEGRM